MDFAFVVIGWAMDPWLLIRVCLSRFYTKRAPAVMTGVEVILQRIAACLEVLLGPDEAGIPPLVCIAGMAITHVREEAYN